MSAGGRLETARLIMRPWREEDATETYLRLTSDPAIGPACGWAPPKSLDECEENIRRRLMVPESYALVPKPHVALELSLSEEGPIGCLSLKRGTQSKDFVAADEGELGFWLARVAWGHGLMSEAAQELLRHSFEDLKLQAIWACHYADNLRSGSTQRRIGMQPHHTLHDVERPLLGDVVDERVNLITREQWLLLDLQRQSQQIPS